MMYYLPSIYTTQGNTIEKLTKAKEYGLNESDCKSIYPQCDESGLQKILYSYWIMPWNPMGSANLLFRLLKWAFNKDDFH